MITRYCTFNYRDDRGEITDILKDQSVDNVTLVTATPGAVRGNHYHLKATVHVYVISGSFQVYSRYMGHDEQVEVRAGTLVTFPPEDLHTLVALEESMFIILASGPRGGNLTVQEKLA